MQITQDNDASSVIEAFEHRGVIVLIHEVGRYPSVTASDGRCTKECAHIDISICHDYPHVTAIAGWRNGRRLSLPINDHLSPRPAGASREDVIAYGRAFLDAAVDAIPTIAQQYDAADEIYGWSYSLPHPISRDQYEAECAAHGIAPREDARVSRWGSFSFPQYGLDALREALLHQKRGYAVEHETEVAEKASAAEASRKRADAIETAKARPVKKVIRRLEAPNYQQAGQSHLGRDGTLWTCTLVERGPRISEDDPSIHGEHLLGSEGDRGLWVTWELH